MRIGFCLKGKILSKFYGVITSASGIDNRYWAYITVGLVVIFSYLRQDLFFCDYAIIWDAAYRMNEGHTIYKDFYTPTGPASFFLPYLAFKIFGYSYASLKIAQVVISISIAVAYKFLLDNVSDDSRIKSINYWIFIALFVLPLGFPWYNTTAFMFSLWAAAIVVRGHSNVNLLIAGLLLSLSILSKQDYGLLGLILSIGLIWVKDLEFNFRLIFNKLKKDIWKILLLIIAALGPIALYAIISQDFAQSFNFGSQYGGTASRLRNLFGTGTSYLFFTAIIVGLYVYYKNQTILLALSVLLLICASVLRATSGLSHISATFYVGSLITIMYFLLKSFDSRKSLILICLLMVPLSLYIMIKPVRNFASLMEVSFTQKNVLYFNFSKIKSGSLDGYFSSQVTPAYLNHDSVIFSKLVAEKIDALKVNKTPIFLNASELTYLNHYVGINAPKGMPLWFHENITFGKSDYSALEKTLDEISPDVVVLDISQDFLISYLNDRSYLEISGGKYLSPINRNLLLYIKK
jgi:hypothetical protein